MVTITSNQVTVVVTSATYTVTFTESGLPSGTNWSVTFNGITQSSSTSQIQFTNVSNGTYSYTVGSVSGYNVSPSYGNVTVNGANVTQSITFSTQPQVTANLTASSTSITLGQSVTLTVTTTGCSGSPIYSWYEDGVYVGEYGSSITYTPSSSGSHTVYVYVVCSNGSVYSNTVIITVNQPSTTYTVSVSASEITNIQTTDDVTFYVDVTASNGSSVSGSAELYLTNGSGTVWGQWAVSLTNGSGSITLKPGMYLASGYDYMYYYAIYNGYQSPSEELTFSSSTAPTSISLSASTTSPAPGTDVTFTISTNGSNISLTLYAYNSLSNAQNAPSLTGQLAQYAISIGTSGSGSETLIPTQLASTTYWVAVYGSIKSNIVTIVQQTVQPTYLSLSNSGTASYMTFTVTSNPGSAFTCYIYAYNSYANASNAPPNGQYSTGQLLQWTISVNNGTGSTALVPKEINTNTQYWVAVYQLPSGTVLRSNILTVTG